MASRTAVCAFRNNLNEKKVSFAARSTLSWFILSFAFEIAAGERTCTELLRNGNTTSGVYTLQSEPGSGLPSRQGYCDQATSGGGWLLLASYQRRAGTNSALSLGSLPTSPAGYSHWYLTAALGISQVDRVQEVRFFCNSSQHSRVIHFKTSNAAVRAMALAGDQTGNTASHWNTGYTIMQGHSGFLPHDTSGANTTSSGGFTEFPFYKLGELHWAIRSQSLRWQCDEAWGDTNSGDTLHQVWVRLADLAASAPTSAPTMTPTAPTTAPTSSPTTSSPTVAGGYRTTSGCAGNSLGDNTSIPAAWNAVAAVRCCVRDTASCQSTISGSDPGTCYPSSVTYQEAWDYCDGIGKRLPSVEADLTSVCTTSCSPDGTQVWMEKEWGSKVANTVSLGVNAARAGVAWGSGSMAGYCTVTSAGSQGGVYSAVNGRYCLDNINSGIYGDSSSWMGGANTYNGYHFIGITLNELYNINGFSVSRDRTIGGSTNKIDGVKTLQISLDPFADHTASRGDWITVGTFRMSTHLENRYQFITPLRARAVRVEVHSNDHLDEMEIWVDHTSFTYEGITFYHGANEKSWDAAEAECVSLHGGHLASFSRREEQYLAAGRLGISTGVWWWFGLNDKALERSWVYSDGTVVTYTNWGSGEPNGGLVYNCAVATSSSGRWADASCTNASYPFVCKVSAPKFEFNGNTYWYVTKNLSWTDAEAYCGTQYEGHLASWQSEIEQTTVRAGLGAMGVTIWNGLHDQKEEGVFTWSDMSDVDFTRWASGNPDGGASGDCVREGGDYLWNDVACASAGLGFICKVSAQCEAGGWVIKNPAESNRTYNALYGGDSPGTGSTRSMLDSDRAFLASTAGLGGWAQLDLQGIHVVLGVVLQGRRVPDADTGWSESKQYVTLFTVQVSDNGVNWVVVPGTFEGNSDTSTKVRRCFGRAYEARYVRVVIQGYVGYPSMRVGLLAEPPGGASATMNQARKASTASSSTAYGWTVDRVNDGEYYVSGFHTWETGDTFPWVRFDFTQQVPIGKVAIYNRLSCCLDRLQYHEIYVGDSAESFHSNTLCYAGFAGASARQVVDPCHGWGRYVWVVLNSGAAHGRTAADRRRIYNLNEIAIYFKTSQVLPISGRLSSQMSSYSPTNCFDRNLATVCHTANTNTDANPFLMLDLGSMVAVSEVLIYTWRESYYSSRLGFHSIYIGETSTGGYANATNRLCYQGTSPAGSLLVVNECRGWGRYLWIVLQGGQAPAADSAYGRILSLAEVQVVARGELVAAVDASLSTTLGGYPAHACIDGVTNDMFCHSAGNEVNPWFRLDFGSSVTVSHVVIHNRPVNVAENLDRLGFHSVYIGDVSSSALLNNKCYSGTPPPAPRILTDTCVGSGRYLWVFRNTNNTAIESLNLAEVQAFQAPLVPVGRGIHTGSGKYIFGFPVSSLATEWRLVRRVVAGNVSHPATDRLAGTHVYGAYSTDYQAEATFSRDFAGLGCEEFMFATGDMHRWMIATPTQVRGGYWENLPRTILKSSLKLFPYTATMHNRLPAVSYPNDPMISLTNHSNRSISDGHMMYIEGSMTGADWYYVDAAMAAHRGANVFCREPRVTFSTSSLTTPVGVLVLEYNLTSGSLAATGKSVSGAPSLVDMGASACPGLTQAFVVEGDSGTTVLRVLRDVGLYIPSIGKYLPVGDQSAYTVRLVVKLQRKSGLLRLLNVVHGNDHGLYVKGNEVHVHPDGNGITSFAANSSTTYDGHRYFYHASAITWDAAWTYCTSQYPTGKMASWASLDDQTTVKTALGMTGSPVWSTYRDFNSTNTWVWADDARWTPNWSPSEPNGDAEDCAYESAGSPWQLADTACSTLIGYICKVPWSVVDDSWHSITVTTESNGNTFTYVDGKLQGSFTPHPNWETSLRIHSQHMLFFNDNSASSCASGSETDDAYVRTIQVFRGSLNASQVAKLDATDPLPVCNWKLVFRQTMPQIWNQSALSLNPTNDSASNYAILDQLERYRKPDNTFKFKMVWPEFEAYPAYDRHFSRNYNIWSQFNNPVSAEIIGFVGIEVAWDFNFNGLQRTSAVSAIMVGTSDTGYHYVVGALDNSFTDTYGNNGYKGPRNITHAMACQSMELYVEVLAPESKICCSVFQQDIAFSCVLTDLGMEQDGIPESWCTKGC